MSEFVDGPESCHTRNVCVSRRQMTRKGVLVVLLTGGGCLDPGFETKGAPCTSCAYCGCRVHRFFLTCAPGMCMLFQDHK